MSSSKASSSEADTTIRSNIQSGSNSPRNVASSSLSSAATSIPLSSSSSSSSPPPSSSSASSVVKSTKGSRKPHPTFISNLPQSPFQHYASGYSSYNNPRRSPYLQSPLRASSTITNSSNNINNTGNAGECYFRTKGSHSSSSSPSLHSDTSSPKKVASPFSLRPNSVTGSPRQRPFRQTGVPLSPLTLDPSLSPGESTAAFYDNHANTNLEHSYFHNTNNITVNMSSSVKPSSTPKLSSMSYHSHLAAQQLAFQNQQRELIIQATRSVGFSSNPVSPRLMPLGSPGPVTPLALEENGSGGYIFTPAGSTTLQLPEHLEKLASRGNGKDDGKSTRS